MSFWSGEMEQRTHSAVLCHMEGKNRELSEKVSQEIVAKSHKDILKITNLQRSD